MNSFLLEFKVALKNQQSRRARSWPI